MIEDASRGIGIPAADGSNSLDTARRSLAEAGVILLASSELH